MEEVKLDPLHIRYRPTKFKGVIGQDAAIKSLMGVLKGKGVPHSFLFTGPSGVGKTTLARILATKMNTSPRNTIEVDAATNSGVDAMRALKTMVDTPGFGADSNKFLIIDECHALSKSAWQSWLKLIEEPPPHLYIVFCTTESGKVPRTIKTRCHAYDLKAVPIKALEQFLDEVCFFETIKPPNGILRIIANKADGSVRQALVYLSMVSNCTDRKEALKILEQADEEDADPAIRLCRLLLDGGKFSAAKAIVQEIETSNMEGVRIIVLSYMSKVLLGSKNARKDEAILAVLEEFSEPFRDYEQKAPLLLALGRLML